MLLQGKQLANGVIGQEKNALIGLPSPGTVVDAVHRGAAGSGARTARGRASGGRTAHLAAHVRRDVGATSDARVLVVEVKTSHIDLISHDCGVS